MKLQVFGCPACQQPFQVAQTQAGQVVQCPACAQQVEIPANSFAAPPPPPAEQQSYQCPECNGQFGITSGMVGHHVGCPHCQASVLVNPPGSPTEHIETPSIDTGVSEKGKKRKSGERWKSPSKPREAKDLFAPGFEKTGDHSRGIKTADQTRSKEKNKTITA